MFDFFYKLLVRNKFFIDKISEANFFRPILLASPHKYQMAAPLAHLFDHSATEACINLHV